MNMHIVTFLQDLAFIMIVAGIVTIIFRRFKQPVVLGYIIAGIILGPHTPPVSLIHDLEIVKVLAEIGVIFLMFSLGLEFNTRKLMRVGAAAFIAAFAEIVFMIFIGYEIGRFFGWKSLDSLFLGAMLAISSTTIIVKALEELNKKKEKFAQLIFGILIIEDILAIGMLVLLSSIAVTGSIDTVDIIITLGKLLVFLVATLVIGILTVTKVVDYVAQFHSNEMLIITVLAFCFGFSLLVIKLDYSVALGAFLIGAIIAESKAIKQIERLIEPVTNMFSAIFFVSIGLLVNPKVMLEYWLPITVITLAVIIGKVITCSLGTFLAGKGGQTSMRVGMGLAQIGEFSFIIATLGITLQVTSPFLYPIIVAVSIITTLLTPYLIKMADPLTSYLAKKIPQRISQPFNLYTNWLQSIRPKEGSVFLMHAVKRSILQIFINFILIIAIFVAGSFLSHYIRHKMLLHFDIGLQKALIWGIALIFSVPFLIAIYLKIRALSMLLAEIAVNPEEAGVYTANMRNLIAEMIPLVSMVGILFILIILSASILPPMGLLLLVLTIVILFTALSWRWFIKLHSRLQVTFLESLDKAKKDKPKI